MTEPFQLKPIGSMISSSEMTGENYHVTKFYSRVKPLMENGHQIGLTFIGYESVEKHLLGECKHCR